MVSPVVGRTCQFACVWVAAVVLFMAAPVSAQQQVTAAGDGAHLWILQPNPQGTGFTTLYRKLSDTPSTDLYPVGASSIQGVLRQHGIAAGGGRLWLIYESGQVQTIQAIEDFNGRRGYTDKIHRSLPKGLVLRSLAANWRRPWALVRVEDEALLKSIDSPRDDSEAEKKKSDDKSDPAPKKQAAVEDDASKTEPSKRNAVKAAPTKGGKQTKAPPTVPSTVQVDRLLMLQKGKWIKVELPTDWPSGAPAWLVMKSDGSDRPWLVTVPDKSTNQVRWYEWSTNADSEQSVEGSAATTVKPTGRWTRHDVEVANAVGITPIASQEQLVLIHRGDDADNLALSFSLLQPGRVTDLGQLTFPTLPVGWSVAPVGDWLAAIIKQKDGDFLWQRINTAGDTDSEPVTLTLNQPSFHALENMYLFLAVMVIATPITILLWKRNPQPQALKLPKDAALSDMGSRMIAALVDILPGLGIAWVVSGHGPLDIIQKYWPGQGQGLTDMWPGAIVVGCFFVYTCIAEMFTGKTLGKHMLGLRVVNMKGDPPDMWQILGRCLFKIFDLIVPLLIILAILSPFRQRLGDLVARTVVVGNKPVEETDKQS